MGALSCRPQARAVRVQCITVQYSAVQHSCLLRINRVVLAQPCAQPAGILYFPILEFALSSSAAWDLVLCMEIRLFLLLQEGVCIFLLIKVLAKGHICPCFLYTGPCFCRALGTPPSTTLETKLSVSVNSALPHPPTEKWGKESGAANSLLRLAGIDPMLDVLLQEAAKDGQTEAPGADAKVNLHFITLLQRDNQ